MIKYAFPALADIDSRVLILGSMPSEASLVAQQYYAYPRNAFWPVMTALLGVPAQSLYRERVAALKTAHIALWDVIAACEREGSLDSEIRHDTLVANDFAQFFRKHPKITRVYFNGKSAADLFKRHVMEQQKIPVAVQRETLPSTSPANARLSFAQKLDGWRKVLS